MPDSLNHRLQERVKELTALQGAARLLQDPEPPLDEILPSVAALLPVAWQYPEITEGRIRCHNRDWSTPGYRETPWTQRESFILQNGERGEISVVYLEERPPADEGPFLKEERDLIRSLSEMLRAYFQHRRDDEVILATNELLERRVAERTASLRRLAAEVCLAEERERRHLAENLHDHLGQALALIRIHLQRLRGDAMLGGHSTALEELADLSDQAIRYTRDLTFELSPPVLYELGLGPALEWLGERTARKHGLKVRTTDRLGRPLPDDLKVMLWKSARELLHNVVKHAEARKVTIELSESAQEVVLEVEDDGRGFETEGVRRDSGDRFGLYSIEERLQQLGGRLEIETAPGRGARVRLCAKLPGGPA